MTYQGNSPAAERGEVRAPLPVGLVHDADRMVVTDPDAEVRGRRR
ncbi:MAG: hypothetical protein ACLPKE_16035 [Streptosporangiaceae bacterium]